MQLNTGVHITKKPPTSDMNPESKTNNFRGSPLFVRQRLSGKGSRLFHRASGLLHIVLANGFAAVSPVPMSRRQRQRLHVVFVNVCGSAEITGWTLCCRAPHYTLEGDHYPPVVFRNSQYYSSL